MAEEAHFPRSGTRERTATVTPVLPARLFIGMALLCAPAFCFAQVQDNSSTHVTETATVDTGSLVLGLLQHFAESAPPTDVWRTAKERTTWSAEVHRYAERSSDLRSRCHEELRKANRDTIAEKAGQCLRSDLLLEESHRRKQREYIASTKGVDATLISNAVGAIDAWLDAATSVIDGIDAGVFTTVDTLKAAKRNLHVTYRIPMYDGFLHVRIAQARAILFSLANSALATTNHTYDASLDPIAVCLDDVEMTLQPMGNTNENRSALRRGLATLKACTEMIERLTE